MKNKTLRIAIVSDAIYPYNKGGKEKRIYEISTRLAAQGFDVHIYCMKWWKTKQKIRIENGVTLHAISPYIPLYSNQRRSIKQAVLFSIYCFKLLFEKFDILDVDHMPQFVLFSTKIVCILRRKRLISTWHEVWGLRYWVTYLGPAGYLAYITEKLSVLLPDVIIAGSIHTGEKIKRVLSARKIVYSIPPGIDNKLIASIKPSNKTSDIIFAGRLLSNKNADLLVKAVDIVKRQYPSIHCIIIGEGPEKKHVKELVSTLCLDKNITFHSFIESDTELYAMFKSSKMLVVPSVREGFGIVSLEANACGIPVITSNDENNGTKEIIKDSVNGYVVHADKEDIAKGIIKLLMNDTYNKMKNACIKNAEQYDLQIQVKKIERIYVENA